MKAYIFLQNNDYIYGELVNPESVKIVLTQLDNDKPRKSECKTYWLTDIKSIEIID